MMYMKSIKNIVYKVKRKLGHVSSEDYIEHLRNQGVNIGKGTVVFDPQNTFIDIQRPWMLEIGEYCKITRGVIILSHDYSRSVIRRAYGEIIDTAKITKIGDNVFIGMNSIILMGSRIGNNVIIGAGSIVSGKIPDNVVIVGNPAKIKCTLDEYYSKRKQNCIYEAEQCAYIFNKKNGRYPTIHEMGAFFPLYLERDMAQIKQNRIRTNLSGDNEDEIIKDFLKTSQNFESYKDFLDGLSDELFDDDI